MNPSRVERGYLAIHMPVAGGCRDTCLPFGVSHFIRLSLSKVLSGTPSSLGCFRFVSIPFYPGSLGVFRVLSIRRYKRPRFERNLFIQ